MELNLIGLGRMGANMTASLLLDGHRLGRYVRSAEAIQRVVDKGAAGAPWRADIIEQLSPRWATSWADMRAKKASGR